MIVRLIELCARNRAFVLLLGLALGIAGLLSARNMKLDAIPDLSDTQVIVYTDWEGRSPTLVEDQVTYPLVTALLAAPRVVDVRAQTMFGESFVYVVFEEGTDLYWARSRVLELLDVVRGRLPPDARPRLGPDATGIGWVYQYALVDRSGRHDLGELRALQDFSLRYALASVHGVAEVATVGGFQPEYQVTVDPDRLRAFGISIADVATAVRRSNGEVGGRVIELSEREHFVRGRGYVGSERDLGEVVVQASSSGTPVRIRDVATVRMGSALRRGAADLNGDGETVSGIIVMRTDENALNVIRGVEQKLDAIRPTLPAGVEIVPVYDRSALVERAVGTLERSLSEEMIVVAAVILLFLLHFRSALLPILSIPLAVLLAFIPMYLLGIPATITSLGGIAIAIGATVDAEIVMVEAAHKVLEHAPANISREERERLLAGAAREVTPAIFFSLLIIAASFIPVFGLTGQAGRMFAPLAWTKTFVMLAAALLSVTVAPALRGLLLRGRIRPEATHPVSRAIRAVYAPFVHVALHKPRTTVLIGLVALVSALPLVGRLGSELMPPLDEGDLLYMPSTLPNVSIEAAKAVLQRQDAALRAIPEVRSVLGKVGRADTPTDPAPLAMVETVVQLRPRSEWRQRTVERFWSGHAPSFLRPMLEWLFPDHRPMTRDELVDDIREHVDAPGWPTAYTQPIRNRIDMLATGIRTPIGVKVYGTDLARIEETGVALERELQRVPGTRSAIFERTTGGLYVDIVPRRDALARYGLAVADLQEVIEAALGGTTVTTTVEGRQRFGVTVRYAEDFRSSVDAVRDVQIPLPGRESRPIALGSVADVRVVAGPPMVRDEAGLLVGYLYVDVAEGRDLGSWVEDAQRRVAAAQARGRVPLAQGSYIRWTGQYEQMVETEARLAWLVPLALLIVVMLLYFQFRNMTEVLIVLLSVPFALVGSVWALYLLDYHLSAAVWVGIIALVGLATQTGVVMIVYIDNAYERRLREGQIRSLEDIIDAHSEGTIQRVRPKLMTVGTMLMGLVPLMWAEGSGADVMKRIAAPMVGGLVTSAFLTLEIIPVVYTYWRWEQLVWRRLTDAAPPTATRLHLLSRVVLGALALAVAALVLRFLGPAPNASVNVATLAAAASSGALGVACIAATAYVVVRRRAAHLFADAAVVAAETDPSAQQQPVVDEGERHE